MVSPVARLSILAGLGVRGAPGRIPTPEFCDRTARHRELPLQDLNHPLVDNRQDMAYEFWAFPIQ